MDVICVRSAAGEFSSTDFYAKLRIPVYGVEHASAVFMGLGEDREAELPHFHLRPAVYERKEEMLAFGIREEEEDRFRTTNQAIIDKLENFIVDISCNVSIVEDIIAYVGIDQHLYFWDVLSGTRSTTPNSTTLAKFRLQPGKNKIKCTHKISQTTTEFDLWLYEPQDQLVVMDIDGTITKSDLTGYIQTVYMGLYTYVHYGLVEFLHELTTTFKYHVIYLTARPFTHKRETFQLLRSVRGQKQPKWFLPEGPLFTTKERVIMALYREVILKDALQTKARTLTAIVDTFKSAGCKNLSPFALGIGNKEADAIAYNSVGIPAERIFLIDPQSKITIWRYSYATVDPSKLETNLDSQLPSKQENQHIPPIIAIVEPPANLPEYVQTTAEPLSPLSPPSSSQEAIQEIIDGIVTQIAEPEAARRPISGSGMELPVSEQMVRDSLSQLKIVRSFSDLPPDKSNGRQIHEISLLEGDISRPQFSSVDTGIARLYNQHHRHKHRRSQEQPMSMKMFIERSSTIFTFNSYNDPRLLDYISELHTEERI